MYWSYVYCLFYSDGRRRHSWQQHVLKYKTPDLIFLIVLFTGGLLMVLFFFSGKVDKLFFLIVLCEKCSLLWINILYLSRKNKKNFSIKEEKEEIFPCDPAVGEIKNSKTNLTCYIRGFMKQHTTFIHHQTLTLYPVIIIHRVVWWILPLLFGVKVL